MMRRKIIGLASALTALLGPTVGQAKTETEKVAPSPTDLTQKDAQPDTNAFVTAGHDLLGFVITRGVDGQVVADHSSHASHSSHSSHSSSSF